MRIGKILTEEEWATRELNLMNGPFANPHMNTPENIKVSEEGTRAFKAERSEPVKVYDDRRDQLLKLHITICDAARDIMSAKNRDYAGGGGDPYANFRASEILGIPPELGLLMRCMDKFKRIESFVRTGTLHVKGEPVDDAIRDVVNYMILLAGLIAERKTNPN